MPNSKNPNLEYKNSLVAYRKIYISGLFSFYTTSISMLWISVLCTGVVSPILYYFFYILWHGEFSFKLLSWVIILILPISLQLYTVYNISMSSVGSQRLKNRSKKIFTILNTFEIKDMDLESEKSLETVNDLLEDIDNHLSIRIAERNELIKGSKIIITTLLIPLLTVVIKLDINQIYLYGITLSLSTILVLIFFIARSDLPLFKELLESILTRQYNLLTETKRELKMIKREIEDNIIKSEN